MDILSLKFLSDIQEKLFGRDVDLNNCVFTGILRKWGETLKANLLERF